VIGIKFGSSVRSGMAVVRSAKLRSFGTMLGIIIGVTSVITIVAIGVGIKSQISGQIHHYGSDIITVRTAQIKLGSSSTLSSDNLSTLNVTSSLTTRDINTVGQVNNVSASAPLTLVPGSVSGDYGKDKDAFVIGTSTSLPSLINQSLEFGNFFSSQNTNNGDDVAVVGENIADKMFKENVPLGASFSFRGQSFIVDGIFDNFNSTPLSSQANFNNAIFIPNSVAESLTNNTASTYEILARADKPSDTNLAAKNIKAALNAAHGGDSGLAVDTGNENLDNNNTILNLLTDLIAGVAAISLLVAGIGIMNVMLVSVSERVREIGIRKAVGATNRQIRSQFIAEATFLSLCGGFIGIILSFLIELGIRVATNLTPDITWQIVVIAVGTSLLVGIVFGTIPAVKASKKDPIEALRAE
jgi:putative ABC transport system permease protein